MGPNIAPSVLKASDIWVGNIMSKIMLIIINNPRFLRVFFKYSILISDPFLQKYIDLKKINIRQVIKKGKDCFP